MLSVHVHHIVLFISTSVDALKQMKLSDQINASFLTRKNIHYLKNIKMELPIITSAIVRIGLKAIQLLPAKTGHNQVCLAGFS